MYFIGSGITKRHPAIGRPLFNPQILQPVTQKVFDVEQVRRGRREDGDVTGPAQPLIALRAVGRHIQEVSARSPDDVAVELVQQLVGALEFTDPLQLRTDHDRSQCALILSKSRCHPATPPLRHSGSRGT